ncbi:MAG TPA: insecticidal toxin protein, partial [Candidatus Thermoplasmatota archaeon]|nr:insecticidal toxin protein [Candidatus Thermoplasmatota archaeon]
VPCVTGPYASVNCKLTLLKSSIRKSALLGDGYAREGTEDARFDDYFGSVQSIVTSSAQNDAGMFETNLRDERYLPFEHAGAVSEWQLELPADPSKGEPAQFDYGTISDVILHLRYTAREGGGLLRTAALAHAAQLIKDAEAAGSMRLLSVRHEFPSEWARFLSEPPAANGRPELSLKLRPEHYPFWAQGLETVARVELLVESKQAHPPPTVNVFGGPAGGQPIGVLTKNAALGGLLQGQLTAGLPPGPHGELRLFFEPGALADLWVGIALSSP